MLFKPHGWNVKTGDFFGEGTYAVTIQNSADTAAVMMVAAPVENAAQKLESSVDFANLVLAGQFGTKAVTIAGMSKINAIISMVNQT